MLDWETVKSYVEVYGYTAVALGTMVDQSGLASFVVAGGIVASITERLSLWGVMLAGAGGSFASDLALYMVGRWRAAWLDRWVKSEKNRARLELLREWMHRWSLPLLVFGRFIPWVGRFVPAAAGLRGVGVVRSLFLCAVGGLVCGSAYGALGFYAAESVEWLDKYALFFWLAALAISFPVASLVLRRFDRIVEARLRAPTNGTSFPD